MCENGHKRSLLQKVWKYWSKSLSGFVPYVLSEVDFGVVSFWYDYKFMNSNLTNCQNRHFLLLFAMWFKENELLEASLQPIKIWLVLCYMFIYWWPEISCTVTSGEKWDCVTMIGVGSSPLCSFYSLFSWIADKYI